MGRLSVALCNLRVAMAKKSGITPLWKKKDIKLVFDKLEERADTAVFNLLSKTGEEFVKVARTEGNYQDWTGNLRSSIGYVIVRDGLIIQESSFDKVRGAGDNMALVNFKTKDGRSVKFAVQGTSGDGSEGQQMGKRLVYDLANTYSRGYVLICVVGMKYAVYVEAMDNKDVISRAAMKSEDFIKAQSRSLFNRLK